MYVEWNSVIQRIYKYIYILMTDGLELSFCFRNSKQESNLHSIRVFKIQIYMSVIYELC